MPTFSIGLLETGDRFLWDLLVPRVLQVWLHSAQESLLTHHLHFQYCQSVLSERSAACHPHLSSLGISNRFELVNYLVLFVIMINLQYLNSYEDRSEINYLLNVVAPVPFSMTCFALLANLGS